MIVMKDSKARLKQGNVVGWHITQRPAYILKP